MKRILLLTMLTAMASVSLVGAAERVSVTVPVANIRSGPGIEYDILWKVAQHHPLEIVKKSGPWYLFKDFEGDEGWIHKSLVDNTRTVITTCDQCNVRSGPGTDQKVLFEVGKGIPFKVIETKGDWLRIQHADGDSGWIHRSIVW